MAANHNETLVSQEIYPNLFLFDDDVTKLMIIVELIVASVRNIHGKKPVQDFLEEPLLAFVKNFAIFKLVLESLFNKVVGHQSSNFIKKKLQHRCFPVDIAKI